MKEKLSTVSKGKVLVVDDDPISRKVTMRTLKSMGVMADEVGDGSEVFGALQEKDYDLILADCEMPMMDGLEATRILRASSAVHIMDVPIVALTGKRDRTECIRAGMNDFLSKPLKKDELAGVLEKYVLKRENRELAHKVETLESELKNTMAELKKAKAAAKSG